MITETAASTNATVLPTVGGEINRSSFKTRGGGSAQIAGADRVRDYRVFRRTVQSSAMTKLASEFNTVMKTDTKTDTTTRNKIIKVKKTLVRGPTVRAAIEKFESTAGEKHDVRASGDDGTGSGGRRKSYIVIMRTNWNYRWKAAAFAALTQQRLKQQELLQQSTTPSITKQQIEKFQNGRIIDKKPSILGPKPNLTNVVPQRHDEPRTPQAETVKPTIPTVAVDRHLFNTHKRLSIARDPDARLESVLNATSPERESPIAVPQQSQPVETESSSPQEQQSQTSVRERPQQMETARSSSPEIQPTPNSSFLHNQKRRKPTDDVDERRDVKPEPCLSPLIIAAHESEDTTKLSPSLLAGQSELPASPLIANESDVPSPLTPVTENGRPKSFVHEDNSSDGDHYYDYIKDDEPQQPIYEELCDKENVSAEAPDPSPLPDVMLESSYYTGTAGATNLNGDYYATIEGCENNRVDEDQNIYDDVAALKTTAYQPIPVVDGDGRPLKNEASESLVDIDNSIYGLNTPSESTSSGITSDSIMDEDWVNIDNISEESQEIILIEEKPKKHIETHNPNEKEWILYSRKPSTKENVSISSQSVISFVKDVPEQLTYKRNPCDIPGTDRLLLSVVLKTVFLEEKFESQELSLYFDNEANANTNELSQEIPADIYEGYYTSESDSEDSENPKPLPYPRGRDLPDLPDPRKREERGKRKQFLNFLSLNWIRKIGIITSPGSKIYDSRSEKSDEKKFNSFPKCNSLSSIFYINYFPVHNDMENDQKDLPVRKPSKRPSSMDSQRLSVTRPCSPPPPPPVKPHSIGINSYDSLPDLISNSKGSVDKSNTDSISENGFNQGSELYMRFADEPLYQFYTADISVRTKSVFADDMMEEYDGYEEISSIVTRPSALELITPCLTNHGQSRSLWCEVPEVRYSGIMDTLGPRERKLQEAKFELITSEASYFKSLTVLEKHFVNSHSMNDETILSKNERKILFGNVNPIRNCSEKLLAELEKCWQDNILLEGLCEIMYNYSKENFDIFVKYCPNQIYIDRTLKSLREKNVKFNEALQRLESDEKCQCLSLHSFLMLPMQRITRLPLLLDAILSRMDPVENSVEYHMCELTLASLNTIVQNCNESTRKLERYEEMLLLSQQLEFSSKREMKAMTVASSSRWLVRSGSMLHINNPDGKLTLNRKLIRPTKLYFFLFNDLLFIAKRKSDENYTVVDYCARNFVQIIDTTEMVISSHYKNLLMLTILENHEAKTIEMLLSCDSESSKKRWIEAMSPPISSNPEETIYNEWDCPQVFAEHPYTTVQPDELSLQKGDIVKVLTKMNDGWYHGERIRDGEKGWFPGNYTSEIASQHARAKNLKQRYRLLAMSGSYLQSQQDKIKKK